MAEFIHTDKPHAYYLDGKRMTGVTSIVGVLEKDSLIGWAANMVADYIRDLLNRKLPITEKEIENARKSWSKYRDSAGDIGKNVHGVIEEYVKCKINGREFVKPELTPQAEKMFEKFIEWEKEENIKFLLSEQAVYSAKHFYAGKVDLVFEKKGKIYIGDIKTAKDIYKTNYIQMAGYHICLEELGKIKELEGYCVINIPKQLNKKGEAKKKVKYYYDTESVRNAFLACLTIYRFINKIKI